MCCRSQLAKGGIPALPDAMSVCISLLLPARPCPQCPISAPLSSPILVPADGGAEQLNTSMLLMTQYRFTASSHLAFACPGATVTPAAVSNLAMSESSRVNVSVASKSRAASKEERVTCDLALIPPAWDGDPLLRFGMVKSPGMAPPISQPRCELRV